MSDLEARLQQCFATVFPELPGSEIAAAAVETTPQWDSLATVILITVLEEEFGIVIDPGDFAMLASYSSILEYLQLRTQDAASGVQK